MFCLLSCVFCWQDVVDVVVSNEELDYHVVKEAFQSFAISYKKSIIKENEQLEHLVDNQEREIG